MSKTRTMVTFESSVFNSTEPKDYFINECCYGDDLCKWMIKELKSQGIQVMDEPDQEDFGWFFSFNISNIDYNFLAGYRPEDSNDPGIWLGWVEKKSGLLGAMFGKHKQDIPSEAVQCIHKVISSSPENKNIRWHFKEDFDNLKEELGTPEP